MHDLIIVGAGAAGCVLANRLTASGQRRVLLIEAGGDVVPGREPADIRSLFPLSAFNDRYMWPDTRVHWRRRDDSPAVPLPQGRLIGGSSQVMGMWAMRGHPADYDEWAAGGADGWDWAGVLPYFRRLETDVDFDGPLHGRDGPIPMRREPVEALVPIARAVREETLARGWADIADMNGDFADGHCTLPVSRELESRASAGLHYLTAEVRARANLDVRADLNVTRILIENGVAVGIEALGRDGLLVTHRAGLVIVTAGALRTPVLLMRSGIGPGDELRRAGIDVVRSLDGVGGNLQNHAALYIVAMLTEEGLDPPGLRPAGSSCLRWSTGLPGTPPSDMSLYIRSYLAWHALGRRMASLAPCLMRPASTGKISLAGDPAAAPIIEFNMLSDPRDLDRLKDGMRFAVDIFETLTARGLVSEPVVLTQASKLGRYNNLSRFNAVRAGVAATMLRHAPALGMMAMRRLAKMTPARGLVDDEEALTAFVRAAVSGTGHVCGTTRMGAAEDRLAVVDPLGNVHGVPGLMVADASVMPAVPAANTHIPVIMVAEKIAAGLTGDRAE